MKGPAFKKLLERGGVSQRRAARVLGINERTMRRYVAAEGDVPTIVVYAVKQLIREDLERLERTT